MAGLVGMQSYFSLCGVEIWNQSRLEAYMAHGVTPSGATLRCHGCECLPECIPCEEHRPPTPEGYQLPEIDDAPWYDPTVPQSRNFAGLLVTEVTASGPVDRRLIQSIGHGGVLGRVRYPAKQIEVRGLLIGKTCCAAEYGLRWLTQALLGNFCDCDNCDAHFLSCCPSVSGEDGCLVLDGVPYVRPAGQQEFQAASDFVRNMYNVGLLDGPEVTACRGLGCGCGCSSLTEVEFTLAAGTPWMFLEPETVVEDLVLGGCDTSVCSVEWSKDAGCVDEVDCAPADCTVDPLYPPPPPPPRVLVPAAEGVCVPLASNRTCVAVNTTATREWFESTLVVEVSAGSEPLRNFAIRLFQNPLGADCCEEPFFADCLACSSLYVRYVPAGGVLRFDGVRRRVTMTCFGVAVVDASNQVYTAEGQSFDWIDLACVPYCLAIDTDCFHTADDASVTVYQVGREL